MKVFKVDDGAWHWVIAVDATDALGVWREQMEKDGSPHDDEADIGVSPLSVSQCEGTDYWDDYKLTGTMQSEFERDPSRRYVGCSEW